VLIGFIFKRIEKIKGIQQGKIAKLSLCELSGFPPKAILV